MLAAASIAFAVLAAVLLHPGGAALISADPVPFRISGDVSGLVPGAPADVPLTLENPNASPIRVTSVRAEIAPNSDPPGCPAATYVSLEQPVGITAAMPVVVPARGKVVLSAYARAPRITLLATAESEAACRSTSFVLAYTGSAHS